MSHEKYQSCIDACYRCATACDHCAVSCLEESNVSKMADCIRMDLDCADVCRFAAAAMARGSDFAAQICNLCAEICEKCAEICDQYEHQHCKDWANECRRCAEECRKMAA